MAGRKQKPQDNAAGPGAWIVTFSDCMTLLLCFFVLLMTFSSFDDVELRRMKGIFDTRSFSSVFPIRQQVKDSLIDPPDRPIDHTKDGSDTPTRREPTKTANPEQHKAIPNDDAHRDCRIVRIPSEEMFHGQGYQLSGTGKRLLGLIGNFLRRERCWVIVAESASDAAANPAAGRDLGARRAWAILDHLSSEKGLVREEMSISTRLIGDTPFTGRGRMVEISLMSPRRYR